MNDPNGVSCKKPSKGLIMDVNFMFIAIFKRFDDIKFVILNHIESLPSKVFLKRLFFSQSRRYNLC